jgi:hypothetical protein
MAYQSIVQGSCDDRTTGMFGEAMMAELWDNMVRVEMAGTHKAQEGASGWVQCSHWW